MVILYCLLSASLVLAELYHNLGNLSPYHAATQPNGVSSDLPGDCKMGRHGSRWPLASKLVFITNLTQKLSTANFSQAHLPKNLQFIKSYTSTLGHDNLTIIGRQQLFNHGVIESAQWFSQGYFGRDWFSLEPSVFSTIPEDLTTRSWITPMNTCPKWSYSYGGDAVNTWGAIYLPPITRRLNKLLPGLNLSDADTHGMFYACSYDYAAHGVSPFCSLFTEKEVAEFEYELDLLMDGAFGYNLPGKMGSTLGTLYVNKLIERFSNSSGDSQAVYLEFGHDTTIDMALTALGLAKDTPPLSATGPVPPNRKFRTSSQVPFAAQMVWEKFACSRSFKGAQIRLRLNDATFPLSACTGSQQDQKYGTCSFASFVESNKFSTSISWGDEAWNSTCGASNF
ncbi:phosphoglycerate mutase-like protein [Mycena floridula]|nr:phosphoglycerate mutase-like protein [Mycena floridula]